MTLPVHSSLAKINVPVPVDSPKREFTPSKANAGPAGAGVNDNFLGEGGFFSGLMDIINPLQHIPIVSTIYRHLTGDTIATGAKLAGGTLFGGPIGFIASAFDAIFAQEHGGKYMGETALAMVTGDDSEAPVQVAAAMEEPENDTDNADAAPVTPVAANPPETKPAQPAPLPTVLPPNLPPTLPEALKPTAMLDKAKDSYKQAQILSQLETIALRMHA